MYAFVVCLNADVDPELLYNTDETGLYYRLLPDRTLASNESEAGAKGHKACKHRVTLLVTCNSNGSDKHKLLVIGKSARPLCFRAKPGRPKPDPRVYYDHSKSAWMNRTIFRRWLKIFVRDVRAFKVRTGKPLDATVSDFPRALIPALESLNDYVSLLYADGAHPRQLLGPWHC